MPSRLYVTFFVYLLCTSCLVWALPAMFYDDQRTKLLPFGVGSERSVLSLSIVMLGLAALCFIVVAVLYLSFKRTS
jgi:hypothetical protein